MEWKTDGIRTCILNKLNIFTSDIIVFECFPELSSKVGSHQLTEHLIDKPGRVRFAKLKHITFRIQPIAQIGTHDKEFRTIRLYQVLPLNGYKRSRILYFFCLFTATAQHKGSYQEGCTH
ncbi:unknown [Bacteroides intestinalis CAG:315]|nr:unknown [Bacteroides intestinalis CAG:315]